MNLKRAEEMELIRLAQDGDASARSDLVAGNYGMCRAMAYRRCPYRELIEDVQQDAVFGLYVAIDKFNIPKAIARGNGFLAYAAWWIDAYSRNAVIRYRKYFNTTMNVSYEEIPDCSMDDVDNNGIIQGVDLVEDMVNAANGRLSLLDKKILLKFYRDEWTDTLIAQAIGTSSRFVATLRSKALENLRESIIG